MAAAVVGVVVGVVEASQVMNSNSDEQPGAEPIDATVRPSQLDWLVDWLVD